MTTPVRDVAPRPQLLTYPDSLGGDLGAVRALLDGPLSGLFRGVHILPPFPSSGDRGFAPVTYREIDPRFGSWDDIAAISRDHDVLLDLMINHISRQSPEFRDFARRGRRSPHADLFVTVDKVWPDGDPPAEDLARILLRRPDPFSVVEIEETGEIERVWATFGTADWSEQIDIDVTAAASRTMIAGWLEFFAAQGVDIVRLDAIGYVIKKPGTSCFMVEPEIYDVLDWVAGVGHRLGLTVLPEVHDVAATHARLSAHGVWTYDFVLPALVLHAFETADGSGLAKHLAAMPDRVFTTLDCHDGIPIRPDLDGILGPEEMLAIANRVERAGGNVNHIVSRGSPSGVDVHQLNCTYYSALECDDERYLAARAIQLFARGVPQLYYVGLLAGENDHAAVAASGEGRAINRHNYDSRGVAEALERPVVRRLIELVRLRNTHPAFEGTLRVIAEAGHRLKLVWRLDDAAVALEVDLRAGGAQVTIDGRAEPVGSWVR